jgi:hypothetical protein
MRYYADCNISRETLEEIGENKVVGDLARKVFDQMKEVSGNYSIVVDILDPIEVLKTARGIGSGKLVSDDDIEKAEEMQLRFGDRMIYVSVTVEKIEE